MPTTTQTRTATVMILANQIEGAALSPTYGSVTLFSTEKIVPTTVKRKRPLDLFANSTARFVQSKKGVCLKPSSTKTTIYSWWIQYGWQYSIGNFDTLTRNLGLRPYAQGSLSRLNTDLLLKIKDQKVNLSVSMAEISKTGNMVTNLASEIYSVFHALRSGRPLSKFLGMLKDPKTPASKRLASKWLEYTYGLTPTILEIYGLIELIHQKISEGQYIFVQTRYKDKLTFSSPGYVNTPISSDTVVLKGVARYKVDNRYLRTSSQSGITNPALVLWELVPYSFVFDWIINVGDYLSSLDALIGISDLTVVKSSFFERRETQIAPVGPFVTDRGQMFLVERFTNRLAPAANLPRVLPGYDPNIGIRRMLNATALLRNLK